MKRASDFSYSDAVKAYFKLREDEQALRHNRLSQSPQVEWLDSSPIKIVDKMFTHSLMVCHHCGFSFHMSNDS